MHAGSGLILALGLVCFCCSASAWVLSLNEPVATFLGFELSWRDLVLGGGGMFLLFKGTQEIPGEVEPEQAKNRSGATLTRRRDFSDRPARYRVFT